MPRIPHASPRLALLQRVTDMLAVESPVLEEARLPSPFLVAVRGRGAEAFAPRLQRPLTPRVGPLRDERVGERLGDAAAAKLVADAHRPLSARRALRDEGLREASVAEQLRRLELVERAGDEVPGPAPCRELRRELGARMLAPGEQARGLVANGVLRVLRARLQASTSSASTSGAFVAGRTRSFSRSAVSIRAATSGFSLRNSRTLSRP